MRIERVEDPVVARRRPTFVSAIWTGDLLHVAGQVATDDTGNLVGEDDVATQAEQCFSNLDSVLRAAGVSMKDVAKLVTYLVDPDDYPAYASVKAKWFPSNPPVGTAVVVEGLLVPGAKLEVEATAVRAQGR